MKLTTRILSLALCLVFVLPFVPQGRAYDDGYLWQGGVPWEGGVPYVIENGEVSIPRYDWYENTMPQFRCDVIIPDTIEGYPVTKIDRFAFIGHRSMVTVSIPASVRTISEGAFSSCWALTNITVAKDNSHFSSENGVLFNKDKTTLIQYPNKKPGNSYVIPNGVKKTTYGAFYSTSITKVTIPKSLTELGKDTFYGSKLKSITIPKNLVKIGGAFGFTNLTGVIVPNNVVKIGGGF
ncbi:MAG: leucine-rich repeat domain-containing protein [Oscillospiraceae bacterium]|nr:leucine-rich repeat domain-containing protein [Oscillospiraceae bacterium]